jgi:membrane protein required for colicin V production
VDSPLHPYDVVMLTVLLLSALFGAWKGMAWQLAALASLVVSAGVAVHGSKAAAPYFGVQEPWNRCIAMLVLYLVTSLAIWVLFRLVAGVIDRVQLKEFDRQVGALFGIAKGVLWCLLITFFAVTLSESARQSILRSRSGYYTALLIHRAAPVLPEEIRAVLGKYIEELDRKLDPHEVTPPLVGHQRTRRTFVPEAPEAAGQWGAGHTLPLSINPRSTPPCSRRAETGQALPAP